MALTLAQMAQGPSMDYSPRGASAFLQGIQEAQTLGDVYRKNQLAQQQMQRQEVGRGLALSALADPSNPNARQTFAQGLAEGGDLQGARQMMFPDQTQANARTQRIALDTLKGVDDSIEALNALKNGITRIPASDVALNSATPEGNKVLADIMKIVNEYLKLMSGAAVTSSEAQRLFYALGMPQMAKTLVGPDYSPSLSSAVIERMQALQNMETTFNPAAVRNELTSIANGLRDRINKKSALIEPIDPQAYAMVKESLNQLGGDLPIVAANTKVSSVAESLIDPTALGKELAKAEGLSELERRLLIENSQELQSAIRQNQSRLEYAIKEAVMPLEKIMADYQGDISKDIARLTNSLGINAAKVVGDYEKNRVALNMTRAFKYVYDGDLTAARAALEAAGSSLTEAELKARLIAEGFLNSDGSKTSKTWVSPEVGGAVRTPPKIVPPPPPRKTATGNGIKRRVGD